MKEGSTPRGELIDFGPKRLERVPYQSINELQQVRTEYDEGALAELAQSIKSESGGSTVTSETFELANPLLAGRHTRKSAKRYIEQHADYYKIPTNERVDVQDLTPLSDDTALILIAGHRRRRAIGRLLEEHNINPALASIATNVRDEIEFGQAVGLQLRENVYDRTSPQDEARAIDLSYRYVKEKNGHAPNIRLLSKQLGYSETKVREALSFAALPDSIQQFTADKVLSYTIVKQLKPLYDTYQGLYASKPLEERQRKAELELKTFCYSMLNKQLSGDVDQKRSRLILNTIDDIKGRVKNQEFELFTLEDSGVESRHTTTGLALGRTALGVMKYRLRTGEASDAEIDELAQLVQAAQLQRIENTTQSFDFESSKMGA